jgi:hypothetical protein
MTDADAAVRGPGRDAVDVFGSAGGGTTSTLIRPMTTRGPWSGLPTDSTASGDIASRCCANVIARGDGSRNGGSASADRRGGGLGISVSAPIGGVGAGGAPALQSVRTPASCVIWHASNWIVRADERLIEPHTRCRQWLGNSDRSRRLAGSPSVDNRWCADGGGSWSRQFARASEAARTFSLHCPGGSRADIDGGRRDF